jgi:predicted CXXCH cytochrome family protein
MISSPASIRPLPVRSGRALAGLLLLAGLLGLAACSTDGGGKKAFTRTVAAKACIECHAPVKGQLSRKVVHAPFKAIDRCDVCHRRHGVVGVNVLQKEEPDLCYSCHQKELKGFGEGTVHKAIQGTGKARCTSCHAGHASDLPGLLKVSVNQACFTCHKQKEFEGAKVHAPAAASCRECHLPHAGPQPKLLAREEKGLCARCHDAGAAKMKSAHGGYPVGEASCITCHSPHASADPKGMLPSVHAAGSDCSGCHVPAGSSKGKPFATSKAVPSLCFDCHDAQAADLKKKVVHPPAEGCTDCHSPHAGKGPKLLKKGEKETCAECHAEVVARTAVKPHRPAGQGQCAACHAPHGSDNAKLLATTTPRLCIGCHAKVGEWLGAKTVHQPARTGNCGGCHDPHGSPQEKLLVKEQGQLCFGCHAKVKQQLDLEGVHLPLRQGKCAACHNPHGSSQPRLLDAPVAQLCEKCHGFKARFEKAKLHAPVEKGECAACHRPHQSDQPGLLTDKVGTLCASCHAAVPKALDAKGVASSHAPVRAGKCTACHDPHGAKEKPFLKKGRLETCGECHADLVKRLGRKNAPSHSPAAEGSCDACHASHQSKQPSLLVKPPRELCLECHDAKDEALVKSHSGFAIDKASCLGCHDPHFGDRKGLIRRVAHAPLVNRDCGSCHVAPKAGANQPRTVAKGRALCEVCHGDTRQGFAKKFVHTAVKQELCTGCHSPHASRNDKLLVARGGDVCFTCHDRKPFSAKEQHAPVKAGECGKCHDPHASDARGLLVKAGNELCLGCHDKQKKQLASKFTHAAAKGGACTACHDPHGSPYPAMLVASREKLCLKCHQVNSAPIQRAHLGFPLAGVDCASCHNPHGSDQPRLVRSNTHKVFGACARCHAATGAKPKALLAASPALCFRCHGDKKTEVAAKEGVHAAAQGDCTDCHTPHASDEKGLVKGNKERAVCLGCHDDMRTRLEQARSIHPLKAADGRCTACHRPHSSPQPHLLAQPMATLCLGCHKTHTQFAHPIGKGIIDPNTGKDMNCLSCHDPHATGQPHILVDAPARALCIRCHDGNSENMRDMKKKAGKGP